MSTLGDLPPDQIRLWMHRIAGWVAEHRDHIDQQRVTPDLALEDISAAVPALLPEHGEKLSAIFEDVERFVVPGLVHAGHPKFLSDAADSSSTAGLLGEWLAVALAAGGPRAPVTQALETAVVGSMRAALGLVDALEGIVEESSAAAMLRALRAARDAAYPGALRRGLAGAPALMIYTSAEASPSVEQTAITLGLGEDSVRRLETDGEFRLRPAALRAAVARDVHARLRPLAVIATVGTASCAAVDPVPAIADVCVDHALWLHVDASRGAGLALLPEGRWVLDGVGRADSVFVSSRGWVDVRPEFSVLYTRRPQLLRERADIHALAALKVWMAMRALGRMELERRLREKLRLARRFAEWVETDPDFELMAPVTMAVVCFRARPAGMTDDDADELNRRLVAQLTGSGRLYLTATRVGGRVAMRVAVTSVQTAEAHLADAWTLIHDAFDRTLVD
jgi:aromatic-L-amino-acid decarboxylase